MLRRNYLVASLLLMALAVFWTCAAQAEPVGKFIQVEGQVDLLKGGKLPATPVKVEGAVEVGDMVRTKSESRAQIKFVDDTVLTIAPESRVTVEEYMFDAAKGERKAVLGVLRGLVHTAVEKVYQKEEPDFIMKTQTAVLGVRGTKWYTKLLPNATDVYTEGSRLEVRNRQVMIEAKVILTDLQYTRVEFGLPPLPPVNITKEDLKPLQRQMKFGLGPVTQADLPPTRATGLLGPPMIYTMFGTGTFLENIYSGLYVPPRLESRRYFVIQWYGFWDEYFYENGEVNGNNLNGVVVNSFGWGNRSTFFSNGFISEFVGAFRANESYQPIYGDFTARATGWYKGGAGGRLVGTMNVTYFPCPYNGNGNGYNGNGYSIGSTPSLSLASSPTVPALGSSGSSLSAIGNGNSIQSPSSSTYKATLSGPFVFNSRQQILRATVSGPYTQPGGQQFNLRGILIQRQESPQ